MGSGVLHKFGKHMGDTESLGFRGVLILFFAGHANSRPAVDFLLRFSLRRSSQNALPVAVTGLALHAQSCPGHHTARYPRAAFDCEHDLVIGHYREPASSLPANTNKPLSALRSSPRTLPSCQKEWGRWGPLARNPVVTGCTTTVSGLGVEQQR